MSSLTLRAVCKLGNEPSHALRAFGHGQLGTAHWP